MKVLILWSLTKENIEFCSQSKIAPCICTGWRLTGWKTALQNKEVLIDSKLCLSQLSSLAVKTKSLLDCIRQGIASRSEGVAFMSDEHWTDASGMLCPVLASPVWGRCGCAWARPAKDPEGWWGLAVSVLFILEMRKLRWILSISGLGGV